MHTHTNNLYLTVVAAVSDIAIATVCIWEKRTKDDLIRVYHPTTLQRLSHGNFITQGRDFFHINCNTSCIVGLCRVMPNNNFIASDRCHHTVIRAGNKVPPSSPYSRAFSRITRDGSARMANNNVMYMCVFACVCISVRMHIRLIDVLVHILTRTLSHDACLTKKYSLLRRVVCSSIICARV